MKLPRLPHNPSHLLDFFEQGLSYLGAVSERPWHDRLHLVAEGKSARLCHDCDELIERQLHFLPPGASGARDAAGEVFPGCPLTFKLAELLRPNPICLDRIVVRCDRPAPTVEIALKLWHQHFPTSQRASLIRPLALAWHFSLLFLVRCEIQSVDQQWSLHRLAAALPHGQADDNLPEALDFLEMDPAPAEPVPWPAVNLTSEWLEPVLLAELATDLGQIRTRQQSYLQKELDRVDTYFTNYEQELTLRQRRSQSPDSLAKLEQRLVAARAEHARRRQDQIQRHEIQLIPHLDAVVLVAEPAWETVLSHVQDREALEQTAHFVPRHRRWFLD